MALTLYALKPRFQALLRPLVGGMAAAGITANQVTVATAAVSVSLGLLLAAFGGERPALFGLLPAWLALRMALNAIDGMLAREFGQRSRLGAFLNELGDLVSDAALYLPFAVLAPFHPGWVAAVVVLAMVGEAAGILGQTIGAERRYDGPLGKSDRALVFGAIALWAGLAPLPDWLGWAMPVLAALAALGIVNRVRRALAQAEGRR
ncbi:CDP-alcohol phosphatidyltransferase [Allostella sp. ATCC 35155]|nr:CDP-alcohol phosphatidyltransferase [Stella sp. ATCC 35155]